MTFNWRQKPANIKALSYPVIMSSAPPTDGLSAFAEDLSAQHKNNIDQAKGLGKKVNDIKLKFAMVQEYLTVLCDHRQEDVRQSAYRLVQECQNCRDVGVKKCDTPSSH